VDSEEIFKEKWTEYGEEIVATFRVEPTFSAGCFMALCSVQAQPLFHRPKCQTETFTIFASGVFMKLMSSEPRGSVEQGFVGITPLRCNDISA
jgi:hypothetical protein